MSNQSSEDRLRKDIEHIILTWSSEISGEPREKLHPETDQFVMRLVDLIRNEKLKLLAEVRERVIGENDRGTITDPDSPSYGEQYESTMADKNDLRAELAKLEAEL